MVCLKSNQNRFINLYRFFCIFTINFTTMKKLLLFLLLPLFALAQTSTGQEQEFPYGILVPASVLQVPTTTTWIGTFGADGTQGKVAPQNISIPQIPTNYAPTSFTIGGHLSGIDTKLGALSGTTAGAFNRVWFTADQTTITAGTFDLTNPANKGTAASHQQTVTNDDNQKKYFTTDLIGQPFAMITTFPQGIYSGNLSASTTPTNANQKFTVELYKCNNAGTPIASGVSGAVTGSLGVTVIMILDSGEVTLANASITNVTVSAVLGSGGFTIAAGERIRYHVSAEKVGTAGTSINESVYYGSSYNSFLDVPVVYNSTSIKDVSAVTNGAGTVTDALNTLNSKIPTTYTTIVYVNNANPNSATIFDDENPPTVNDPLLDNDVANLYIGTDASTWVYNGSVYVTKTVPETSNFYVNGTTVDAGNTKTSPINRPSPISVMEVGVSGASVFKSGFSWWKYIPSSVYGSILFDNVTQGYDTQFPDKIGGATQTIAMISDVNLKADKTLTVRKISTNTTLANSDNGTIILLTASCTVTLPNGLMSGFNCSFSTSTGATLTYALGGSVTLINNAGTTMAQNLSHTIVNTGTTNEYLTAGNL